MLVACGYILVSLQNYFMAPQKWGVLYFCYLFKWMLIPAVISKVPYCFLFLFCDDTAAVGNSLIQQEIDLLKVLWLIYLLIYLFMTYWQFPSPSLILLLISHPWQLLCADSLWTKANIYTTFLRIGHFCFITTSPAIIWSQYTMHKILEITMLTCYTMFFWYNSR